MRQVSLSADGGTSLSLLGSTPTPKKPHSAATARAEGFDGANLLDEHVLLCERRRRRRERRVHLGGQSLGNERVREADGKEECHCERQG